MSYPEPKGIIIKLKTTATVLYVFMKESIHKKKMK